MTFLVTTPIPAPGMEILAAAGPVDVLPAPPTAEQLAELCSSGNYEVVVSHSCATTSVSKRLCAAPCCAGYRCTRSG